MRIEEVNDVAGNRQRRAVANRRYSVPAFPIFKGMFLAIRDCQHRIQRRTYPDTLQRALNIDNLMEWHGIILTVDEKHRFKVLRRIRVDQVDWGNGSLARSAGRIEV